METWLGTKLTGRLSAGGSDAVGTESQRKRHLTRHGGPALGRGILIMCGFENQRFLTSRVLTSVGIKNWNFKKISGTGSGRARE